MCSLRLSVPSVQSHNQLSTTFIQPQEQTEPPAAATTVFFKTTQVKTLQIQSGFRPKSFVPTDPRTRSFRFLSGHVCSMLPKIQIFF